MINVDVSLWRPCFIHTLDGVFDATCSPPFYNLSGRRVCRVCADNGLHVIDVPVGVCNTKFDDETKPTFYGC